MTDSALTPQPRFADSYSYRTKLVIPGLSWQIFGHPANWAYFCTTALAPADAADRETKTGTRKAHTRRKYAGDTTPSNVTTHPRDWLYDPGRSVGAAIPGWSFILDDGTEKRQFTTNGDVQNLILYLQDEVKNPTKVYTQGAMYLVTPAEGG